MSDNPKKRTWWAREQDHPPTSSTPQIISPDNGPLVSNSPTDSCGPFSVGSDVLDLVLSHLCPNVVDMVRASMVCKSWHESLRHPLNWRNIDAWSVRLSQGADERGLKKMLVRSCPRGVVELNLDGCRRLKELPLQLAVLRVTIHTLEKLSLRECGQLSPMSVVNFVSIANSLQAPLHTLDLSWCHFFSDGHAARLPQVKTIKTLKLRGTLIGDMGVEKIVRAMPNLEFLDVSVYPYHRLRNGNIVSDKSVDALKSLPHLQVLKVCGRRTITFDNLEVLVLIRQSTLKRVDARHCTRVTTKNLQKLQEQFAAIAFPTDDDGEVSDSEIELCPEGDPVPSWIM